MFEALEKTAGLLSDGFTVPWMLLLNITWKAGSNFVGGEMTKEEAVMDAIKGTDSKLDEIKAMLVDIAEITLKSFGLLIDIRYRTGVERIAATFDWFIDVSSSEAAWIAKMEEFKGFAGEIGTEYRQCLDPKKIEQYLSTLADQKDGLVKMMNALEFILMTECKFLYMMAHYNFYKADIPAVNRQFELFNSHVEILNGVAKNLAITRIIPIGSKVSISPLSSVRMINGSNLQNVVLSGSVEALEAVSRYITPHDLNTVTQNSGMQIYKMGIPGISWKVRYKEIIIAIYIYDIFIVLQ